MAGRICKEQGCGRPVIGRGMCCNHYEVWRRRNKDLLIMRVHERMILAAMPATAPQLVERTGLGLVAVRRALDVLNAGAPNRQAYIYDWVPPSSKGKRWEPAYREGCGPNAKLEPERRKEHSRACARRLCAP